MTVDWVKCEGGGWCAFDAVNLDHPHLRDLIGVYVIWFGDRPAVAVRPVRESIPPSGEVSTQSGQLQPTPPSRAVLTLRPVGQSLEPSVIRQSSFWRVS